MATNPSMKLVKAPKLLWTDCALVAWLAGIKSPADGTTFMNVAGFRLEQTLFQTPGDMAALDPQQRKLHFWRYRAGHKVDFFMEEAGKLVALEIQAGTQIRTGDATGIRALRDDLKRKASLVRGMVSLGNARPLEEVVLALHWGWQVPT